MKKIFRVVLGLFFALTTTYNYAQINVQQSKVVISEAEIISLSKTLKKYRNTNYLRVDDTRKKELDSLSLRINELTELLYLQKDTTSNSKKLASKTVTDLVSKKDVVEKSIVSPKVSENENSENALALNKLEQEVAELKELVSEVLNNQVTISNSPVETKEVETFIQSPPVIIEKTVLKTDTIYVLKENDGNKTIDSLNMNLLAVKNNQLITQQLLIDSLKSQLLEKKVSVPTEIKKEAEVTTLKLYFFNNEFALNEINKAILDELFLSISSEAIVNFNIKGFASASGNANYNKILSTKRSQEVYNYLVSKGVPKEVIKSESFGVDYTEEDASKARRVEIQITKML